MRFARWGRTAGKHLWLGVVAILLPSCNLVLGINEPKDWVGSADGSSTFTHPGSDASFQRIPDAGSVDGSAGLYAWADWPMPNPPSTRLPNPQSYDIGRVPGVVLDNITHLEWQRTLSEGRYAWLEALAYCQSLAMEGGRWRLPSRIELLSIVDFTEVDPVIDQRVFPATPSDQFWTASPFATDTSNAWTVHFGFGAVQAAARAITSTLPVRCVRTSDRP